MIHYLDKNNELYGFDSALTDEEVAERGFRIATDEEVQAIQNPQQSLDEMRIRALAEIRDQRAPILDALAGIGFDALMSEDTATAQAVAQARAELKDITALSAFLAATTYDDMKTAILARYRQIADATPSSVQIAFAALVS